MKAFAIAIVLSFCTLAFAQSEAPLEPNRATSAAEASAAPHPILPTDSTWAFTLVTVIIAMFLSAMVVGPISRANMEEELPPTHSHDEPPGTSGHHGAGGTVDHSEDHTHGAHH